MSETGRFVNPLTSTVSDGHSLYWNQHITDYRRIEIVEYGFDPIHPWFETTEVGSTSRSPLLSGKVIAIALRLLTLLPYHGRMHEYAGIPTIVWWFLLLYDHGSESVHFTYYTPLYSKASHSRSKNDECQDDATIMEMIRMDCALSQAC